MGLPMRRVLKPLWILLPLGLCVTAFICEVTRSKLLQMAWFRWLYELILVWLAKAHAITDPITYRIEEWFAALRHRARKWLWLMKPGRPSRFVRRLARIR